MRQVRYPSLIRRLFAEHHVYVRSGPTSRYVVLSWPWQIGVTLALAAIVLWAGGASYGWLATHLSTLEQDRELARLAQLNQRLEVIAASYPLEREPSAQPPARLVIGLEEVKAGPRLALSVAEAAVVEVNELRAEPGPAESVLADEHSDTLYARLAEQLLPAAIPIEASVSGRDWLYDRITRESGISPLR